MSWPPYSVVFSTCLSRDTKIILLSLKSLFKQRIRPGEIIVVVNGCNLILFDKFKLSVLKYFDSCDSNLISFLFVERGNLSAARNCGVQASLHELIFFSDDDDLWHPLKSSCVLRRFVNTTQQNYFCLIHGYNFYPYHLLDDSSYKPFPPSAYSFLAVFSHLFLFKRSLNPYLRFPISSSFFLLMLGNSLGGGSSIVATRSLCLTFPFNEAVSRDEDRLFFIRLSLAGIHLSCLNYPLVTYLRHNKNMASQLHLQSLAHLKANFNILQSLFRLFVLSLVSTITVLFVSTVKILILFPLKLVRSLTRC